MIVVYGLFWYVIRFSMTLWGKKSDLNIFLWKFVDELKILVVNGIIKNGEKFKVWFLKTSHLYIKL